MLRRVLLVLVLVFVPLVAVACGSFADGTTPKTDDASPAPSSDGGGGPDAPPPGDPDGASEVAGLVPLPIGGVCKGHVPPWRACFDYQDKATKLDAGVDNTGKAMIASEGENRFLRATTDTGGVATEDYALPDGVKRVLWSFDVHIIPQLTTGSEFGSLVLPVADNGECQVQIDRKTAGSDDKIELVEYCKDASGNDSQPLLVQLALPSKPNGWFNLLVDVNFALHSVKAYLRGPGVTQTQGSGTLKTTLTTGAQLKIGLSFAPAKTQLDMDNFVVWWSE